METPSTAQTLDKRTLLTFRGPVSMPGVTLPAGKGMFFAMRAERFEPASTPEVRFTETAAGLPAAIRATTQGRTR